MALAKDAISLTKMFDRPCAIAARYQINRPTSIFIQICAQTVVPPFCFRTLCLAVARHS
jgi:hypothetical protein